MSYHVNISTSLNVYIEILPVKITNYHHHHHRYVADILPVHIANAM